MKRVAPFPGPQINRKRDQPRAEYVLTEKGRELRPMIEELREWGEKHTK